jgi:hypothetical protein
MLRSFYPDDDNDDIRSFAQTIVTKNKKIVPVELQEVIIRSKNYDFAYLIENFSDIFTSVRAGRRSDRSTLYN